MVASTPEHLVGCAVAFVDADRAEAALDAGVDDVLATAGHPLGARSAHLPPLVMDVAVEVPGYGDHYPGPYATAPVVELDGTAFSVPDLGLGADDRVLSTLHPGTAAGLGVVLAALQVGASLVLVRALPGSEPDAADELAGLVAAERVTRVFTA